MDYSARSYSDYERQHQSTRLAPYGSHDSVNPYSLEFPGDLYGMPSSFSNAKPQDLNGYNSQSSYAVDRRQSYGNDFPHDDYSQSVPIPRLPEATHGIATNNMAFGSQPVSTYNDRLQYTSDRFPQPSSSSQPQPPSSHSDFANGSSNSAFRPEEPISHFDEMSRFGTSQQNTELSLPGPSGDSTMSRVPSMSASGDLHSYLRPYLDQYIRTTNRLAFGERTVIVLSPKVAQKSYGNEKRFICPPPTAILIGNSWWAEAPRKGEDSRLSPPRVVVSISGESAPPDSSVDWTGASGKSFDVNDPPGGTTYIGRCVGKQLYISDVDDKKKKVEALVKISAPGPDEESEKVIGVFPSRAIKVISKPSKKRQSAKNLELCINHGATISLFHRLRSQTVSTKYLCVSGSGSAFRGSDGAPMIGLEQRARLSTPSFIARTSSWDPFVMYIVDISKPSGGVDTPPPPPPQVDYPSPPPNAMPFPANGASVPIYYNQTVVLQCLTSGVVSPVLIIRKVDSATQAVGGGLQPKAKGVSHLYCAPGEVWGDPVSQLHKIAFEVYDPNKAADEPGGPGITGPFLSCMGEKVNTYRPIEGRQWNHGARGQSDYNGHSEGSVPGSPSEYPTNDGGRVQKKRGRSDAPTRGNRRRAGSAGSSGGKEGEGPAAANGATWQVDVGETSVWTVVGTDQIRYNFYIPPALYDQPHPPLGSFPVPSKPLTPFPSLVKYLPPERMSEAPKGHNLPPSSSKHLTLYGENFDKNDPVNVYFGAEPSSHVEVRCNEVVGCAPPVDQSPHKRRPLLLVRSDGIIFPSPFMYP